MLQRRSRTYGLVLLAVALLASYAYYEMRGYVYGPQLIISAPTDGFSVTEEILAVEGTAKNITEITLNGRPIFIDEDGHFKEDVLLLSGYNVLALTVVDRYERTNTQYLRGIYTPETPDTRDIPPNIEVFDAQSTTTEDSMTSTTSTTTLKPNTSL